MSASDLGSAEGIETVETQRASRAETGRVPSAHTGGHCRICGNAVGNRQYRVREMMFGTGETFDYLHCAACECLQLMAVPDDVGRYYGGDYYSFGAPPVRSGLARWLYARRDGYAFTGRDTIGRALYALYPKLEFRFLSRMPLTFEARILDVGCGAGAMLQSLRRVGFRWLLGVDPLVAEDIRYPDGVHIRRCTVADVDERFDVVMFNHSLEHMPEQAATLAAARRLLAPGGTVVVRIPTVSSHAWQVYGIDWAQLDAPRHLFLHSDASFQLVAAEAGLRVVDCVHDSNAFQFWGSELYRRGIALRDYHAGASSWRPSAANVRSWEREAARLNAVGRGDQAAFFLRAA